MLLMLAPSAAQKQALDLELAAVQNPASLQYHKWLTPGAFADAYANSAADVSAISAWLESQGFQVAPLPAGRGWVEFSGTVAQVEQAFHTQVDAQTAPTGTRFALADGISIPAAFAPLVQGLVSLDGALSTPALTQPQAMKLSASELAAQTSLEHATALTPQLAGKLLHFDTLHTSGITGAGESIAIPASSNVNSDDVTAFRVAFGLPVAAIKVLPSGSDTGFTADQAEATLAASWAGAAAPGAQIILVPAATTGATDGLDLSLAAIVDQALAHTVAVGYSNCEAALAPAHQAFYAALYRQAAAEGISVIAAAGDSGGSACHLAGSATPVSSGYAVNALASTPWNTAVGVAAIDASSSSLEAPAFSAWSKVGAAEPAYAGGGGSSNLYATPPWQPIPSQAQQGSDASGVASGIPARLLPDLALPTAIDSTVNHGLAFCFSGANPAVRCTLVRSGGSSAAAALFAGIAALVNEKNGQQGNLAPHLYSFSRQSGAFTDVEQGSAKLPCLASSPGCEADGQIGFTAGAGYDLATGLGVVNAHTLVTAWATPETTGTGLANVTNTIGPGQTINPSGSIVLSANVVSGDGGPVPTGTVTFRDTTLGQTVASVALEIGTGETSTATDTVTGVLTQGGHQLEADYSGDVNYAPASSALVVVEVQPSSTTTTVTPSTDTPAGGATFTVSAAITSLDAGTGALPPSGTVDFRLDGVSQGLKPVVTGSPSTASISMTAPYASGAHQVAAFYSGDINYNNSTSQAVTITVNKSPTTIVVVPATLTPTAGSSLLVTANITASNPATASPTGTVTLMLDGASQGTATVTSGSPSTASVTIPLITAGPHTLTAAYSGDNSYAGSTSAPVAITATKGATVTTITATPPILAAGAPETLAATIAPAAAVTGTVYTIAGTVSFYDNGATLLGTAAIVSNVATLSGISLANNVSHSITAIYSGDPNWLASTSTALALAATTQPDSVVLSSNLSALSPGQALVLTVTVTPTSTPALGAEQNPTGSVVFYNGTTIIGTAALVGAPVGDSSIATLTSETLPGGQDVIYAAYLGDLYYDAATSNLLTLDIQDFTITPAPTNPLTNLNIVQGTSGSASFVVGGLGGFNNTVQVICAVPSQDDMTCTTSPQQTTPPGTVTFVIQTFLPGQQTTAALNRRTPPIWPRAAGGTALAVLCFFLLPFGRRARIFARRGTRQILMLLLLLAGIGGAGIGCSSVTGVNGTGTPLGVATLKITATAYIDNTVVNHSVYLTVNVVTPSSTQ
jgi:hypothetical protein